MKLDYAQLAALAAVVREGSFERAARVLHVTPSAVSQRVKQFEQRMGSVLVVRQQPCRATEAARALVQHAERVALLEAELPPLAPRTRSAAAPSRASLRIAVNADSLATWVVPALAAFAAREGAVALDVVLDDQDHTGEALRRGEVLAAVTAAAQPVQGCRSHALGRMRYLATASPAFVKRWFARGVDADALAAAPCIVFNRKDQLQSRWLARVTRRRTVEPPCHWLPSTQAFVDAALAGLGWGMNPQALVAHHIAARRLVELIPGRAIDVPLVWQASRLALPALERLTDAMLAAAKQELT